MASSTAPELPLANAIIEAKEHATLQHPQQPSRTDSHSSVDTEKHAAVGGSGTVDGGGAPLIEAAAEDRLVRKQVGRSWTGLSRLNGWDAHADRAFT
jgi:hypothetical protein